MCVRARAIGCVRLQRFFILFVCFGRCFAACLIAASLINCIRLGCCKRMFMACTGLQKYKLIIQNKRPHSHCIRSSLIECSNGLASIDMLHGRFCGNCSLLFTFSGCCCRRGCHRHCKQLFHLFSLCCANCFPETESLVVSLFRCARTIASAIHL